MTAEQDKIEQDHFTSTIAHDLKIPLQTINIYLDHIRENNDLEPVSKEYLEYAISSSTDMMRLIDDLLSHSTLDRDTLDLQPINLDTLVKTTIRSMKAIVKDTGTEFEIDTLPTVTCDEIQIKRLITNLIENALKYKSEAPPHIAITYEEKDSDYEFCFADNGIGMDENRLDDIFTMFARLESKGDYPGSGIGLASCKKIVESHGGKIWAKSSPGKGSKFYFTLPKQNGT